MEVIQPAPSIIRSEQQGDKPLEKDSLLQCVVALLFFMGLIIASITIPIIGAQIANRTISITFLLPFLAIPLVLMVLPYMVVQLAGGFAIRERRSRPPRRWQRYPIVDGRLVSTESSPRPETRDAGHVPWIDDSSIRVPDWLLPLLESRTAPASTHELDQPPLSQSASPYPSEALPLTRKQLEDRILLLETKVMKLQKLLDHSLKASTPKKTQPDSVLHEIAALKVLLVALEEQYEEGRIPKKFYRRKKRQLKSQLKAAPQPVDKT
jgi:hypothetical protein